jgi:hypothetical protein
MNISGKHFKVQGRLFAIPHPAAEEFEFSENAEVSLRESWINMNLLTFTQKLLHTAREYRYAMERDNGVALSVPTFERWCKSSDLDTTEPVLRDSFAMTGHGR